MIYFKQKTVLLSLTICIMFGSDAVAENFKNVRDIGYLYNKPTNTLESAEKINKGLAESLQLKPSKEYLEPKVNLTEGDGEILEKDTKEIKGEGNHNGGNTNGIKTSDENSTSN